MDQSNKGGMSVGTDTQPHVTDCTAGDLDRVCDLLRAADLPTDDVDQALLTRFVLIEGADGTLSAVGGMEVHDRLGLLRSVAVPEVAQGKGLGGAIVAAVEERARSAGLEALYLLTTTADAFFQRLDYEVVDRSDVPASIQATRQFADLCPSSATTMRKALR